MSKSSRGKKHELRAMKGKSLHRLSKYGEKLLSFETATRSKGKAARKAIRKRVTGWL